MSANKYGPHLLVLPEDDANRQLANGFHLEIGHLRRMQVLPVAGGWNRVLDEFKDVHIGDMDRDANRFIVLLIDFDDKPSRLDYAKGVIPSHLVDRVFILGVLTNPENLKGKLEGIGAALAKDCRDGTSKAWDNSLLKHNAGEVARLREHVRPFLF